MKKRIIFGLLCLVSVAACHKKGPESAQGLNRIHFDFESASVKSDMMPVLNADASYLIKHKINHVVIEGNCDERGTNEFNLALGDERAVAVKDYLVSRGIGENKIRTVSYGEERPLDKGHNESAWYMNRRADFVRQ